MKMYQVIAPLYLMQTHLTLNKKSHSETSLNRGNKKALSACQGWLCHRQLVKPGRHGECTLFMSHFYLPPFKVKGVFERVL